MSKAYLKSPIGILEIIASENGICEINFVYKFEKIAVKYENLKLCLNELEAYFNGKLKKFSVRLDIKTTNFRAKIYEALQKVPYGETTTYAALALAVGHKNAYRAVGSANAKNPVPIIVPCHRVLASSGLGGYSGGDGLPTKIWLLEHEAKHK
ncbi:MAG: methylated-DNA--[protein]-cysteine S-methyltransferase [Campylobacter sp.]|nr:methylated-DNA--[protein]-cysteine S-methyltransferase [Campylobacter sp.]